MPDATADAMKRRLVTLDLYPDEAQAAMDGLREALEERHRGERAIDAAEARRERERAVREAQRPATPWLERLAYVAIGAAAVGVAVAIAH